MANRYSFISLALLAVAIFLNLYLFPAQALAQTQQYTVTDLGTLDGQGDSYAHGINSSGQVAGSTVTSGQESNIRAFLYSRGLMKQLGTLGGIRSEASALNDAGQVVGHSTIAGSSSAQEMNAFLYQDGVMTSLGTLPQDTGSFGFNINNSGQVVGASYKNVVNNSTFPPVTVRFEHAFLYSGGVMQDLSALLGGAHSRASGINDSGVVVGRFVFREDLPGCPHPFLYSGGTMTDLGALSGFPCSEAVAVNNFGEVIGVSRTQDTRSSRFFLYRGGVMHDLGNLGDRGSHASDINNAGQIVGAIAPGGGTSFAFLYSDGTLLDLNSLIPAGSGWTLGSASNINDAGQIVGSGVHNGARRAYLLTPTVPTLITEPNSDRALALDSVTFVRDPFPVRTAHNFSDDGRTRVALFARSVVLAPDEPTSVLTAQVEDMQHGVLTLPVEYVGKVHQFGWLTQIIVRLPEELEGGGDVKISIALRGVRSNSPIIGIKPAAGNVP